MRNRCLSNADQSGRLMFKFRRAAFYRDRCFKGMSIAFEYATARKWARGNPLKLWDKQRPTVGEMVPPPKKADNL
jgi:hypothetical protein